MNISFEVEKVMCGGCASNIEKKLQENPAISDISVDVETGRVSFSASDDVTEWAKQSLAEIGYPEKGATTKADSDDDPMAAFKAGALGK